VPIKHRDLGKLLAEAVRLLRYHRYLRQICALMRLIRSLSIERSLGWSLALLLAFSFVAAVPAAQTVLMVTVGLSAIATTLRNRNFLRDAVTPQLVGALMCWCVIASASSFWSPGPLRSIEASMLSCWLPAACFLAALHAARSEAASRLLVHGIQIGLTWLYLSMASISFLGYFGALSTVSGGDVAPSSLFLVRCYPGPGLSSTFILLAMPVLVWATAAGLISKRSGFLYVGFGIVCGAVTYNRMFWLGVILLLAVLLLNASRSVLNRDSLLRALAAIIVCAVVLAAAVVASTLVRYNYGFTLLGIQRALAMIASDGRFMIWTEWLKIGEMAPLLGAGFGKMAAAHQYQDLIQQGIKRGMTPFANVHPHNLFLSLWIQTGVLGLVSFTWLIAALVRELFRLSIAGSLSSRQTMLAGLSLVGMLILKNSTDDFYDKAVPVIFWILSGLLLGSARSRLPQNFQLNEG
jgi:O-antigen ligase